MNKPAGIGIIVGVFSILGVLILLVKGGVQLYSHIGDVYEERIVSKARDFDVVLRLESQNRTATNFYEDAKAGNNPDISPATAEEWLDDLDYDREQIQKMKMDYTGNSPAGD